MNTVLPGASPGASPGESASFFGAVTVADRDEAMRAYLAFLSQRNGSLDSEGIYPTREAWLREAEGWGARYAGHVDADAFARGWSRAETVADPVLLLLLAILRMNAGEAYGVEVVRRQRGAGPARSLARLLERLVANEEIYHTRILTGTARHFGLPAPEGASAPPLALRLLIGALARSSGAVFHSVLLAAEISGVFQFNWVLQRVSAQFRDQPALREAIEARLLEVIGDEIGHIAFNRLLVGAHGLAAARGLAAQVASAGPLMTPELGALGFKDAMRGFARFDLAALPAEARRRAFFV